jgi:tetratricopeptide (TPR) repeat protein
MNPNSKMENWGKAPTMWENTENGTGLLCLWEDSRRLFRGINRQDFVNSLMAACLVERDMIGRHCGGIGNKVAQYLSIVDWVRSHKNSSVDSIEIGALFGGSCLMKLFALRDLGSSGKVFCIDPMTGYYNQPEDILTGVPVTAQNFFANIRKFGFSENWVELLKVKSDHSIATAKLNVSSYANLMIDGDHSYQGVKDDWESFQKYVAPGGLVLFDDYGSHLWPGITLFIDEVLEILPSEWMIVGVIGSTIIFRRADSARSCEKPSHSDGALSEYQLSESVKAGLQSHGIEIERLKRHLSDYVRVRNLYQFQMALVYRKLKNWQKVESIIDSIQQDFDKDPCSAFSLLISIADHLIKQDQTTLAEKRLLQALSIGRIDGLARFEVVRKLCDLYRCSREYHKVTPLLIDLISDPTLTPDKKFFVFVRLGYNYKELQLDDKAIEAYNLALSISGLEDGTRFTAIWEICNLYRQAKRYAEAACLIKNFLPAQDLASEKRFSLFSRLGDSFMQMGFYDAANVAYQNALEIKVYDEKLRTELIKKIAACGKLLK